MTARPVFRRIGAGCRIFALSLLAAAGARADSGEELADAKQAFESVKIVIVTVEVNRSGPARRESIWAQYYRAVEQLQRMDVHHQMMIVHNHDRDEQFAAAYAEFTVALRALDELLPVAIVIPPGPQRDSSP